MLGTFALAGRPLAATPLLPRPFLVAAVDGEYGYAAWSFSRQAKLNAWSWHGVGRLLNVNNWAVLGNAVYMRSEADTAVYVTTTDSFLEASATNAESTSVEATTQWLDFGKPGKMKALVSGDFDCQGVETLEIYVSVNGGRTGTLAATIDVDANAGGWTYNEDPVPLEEAGAATSFMLKFIGAPNVEVQVNKFTLHFDELA